MKPAKNPFYTADHEAFRETVRRFVAKEVEPFANEWDEAGEFPRELYRKASAIELMGMGFPEAFAGYPADQFMRIVASQKISALAITEPNGGSDVANLRTTARQKRS